MPAEKVSVLGLNMMTAPNSIASFDAHLRYRASSVATLTPLNLAAAWGKGTPLARNALGCFVLARARV